MNTKRRLWRLIASLGLALGLASTAVMPASAVHSLGPCFSQQTNKHFYVQQNVGLGVNDFQADILVRDTFACTDDWGYDIGRSWVLPVNIQGNGLLVQLGYGRKEMHGDLNWWYTPWGANNMDGVLEPLPTTNIPDPIPGRTYRLQIQYVSSVDRWRFYVDDLTDGAGNAPYVDGHIAAKHHGLEWWAGFENFNHNDMVGGSHSWTPITQMNWQQVGSTINEYRIGVMTRWGASTGSSEHVQSSMTADGRSMIRAYTD